MLQWEKKNYSEKPYGPYNELASLFKGSEKSIVGIENRSNLTIHELEKGKKKKPKEEEGEGKREQQQQN